MRIRPATPGEGSRPSSFLQCGFWGEFKSAFGWKGLRFIVEGAGVDEGSDRVFPLLVLVRNLRLGLSFAYVPLGPEIEVPEDRRGPFLAELSSGLKAFLPRSCLFIRFDPPWRVEEDEVARSSARDDDDAPAARPRAEPTRPFVGPPLVRAASDVQVPDTIIVDLRRAEDEILAGMKPKWRYNVRLAQKKGVEVEEAGADSIPEFYALYTTTAARDRIALHPESYYRRLFAIARESRERGDADAPDVRLWIARYEGKALAAIVTLFRGDEAVYLYGASSDERRELMPAYALQWTAMRAAKAAGCASYDLFGIPPFDDPEHPMAGLYRFKSGFGGKIVRRAGSWDYPLKRLAYAAFHLAERARRWWYKDARKRLRKKASTPDSQPSTAKS